MGLSAALLLFWIWRDRVDSRRAQEAALFQSYVDNSLTDYVFSVTRCYELLRHGKGESRSELQGYATRSVKELKDLLAGTQAGWIEERLSFVLPLQDAWAKQLDALPTGSQKGAWLKSEANLRSQILYMLEDVRYQTFHKWKRSQEQILELNALIYSLSHPDED
jgi:hypothetical protein